MYKLTYFEDDQEKHIICKVKDLGQAMKKLQSMGITKYKLTTTDETEETDLASPSNVF